MKVWKVLAEIRGYTRITAYNAPLLNFLVIREIPDQLRVQFLYVEGVVEGGIEEVAAERLVPDVAYVIRCGELPATVVADAVGECDAHVLDAAEDVLEREQVPGTETERERSG